MLPHRWRFRYPTELVRVGPQGDGGYVIAAPVLDDTRLVLGLGLSDDWRFEEEFSRRARCDVACYDHTVTARYWRKRLATDVAALLSGRKRSLQRIGTTIARMCSYRRFFRGPNATHHRTMVGYAGSGSTTLGEIVQRYPHPRVFVKMDIEGWEYRVLDQLRAFPERINGFVVEFHDIDLHRERISEFLDASGEEYGLVHVHANNCGGVDANGDPLVIEMTWAHRRYLDSPPVPASGHPLDGLDFPCDTGRGELQLTFEPGL
jgi:hypothetical protein